MSSYLHFLFSLSEPQAESIMLTELFGIGRFLEAVDSLSPNAFEVFTNTQKRQIKMPKCTHDDLFYTQTLVSQYK